MTRRKLNTIFLFVIAGLFSFTCLGYSVLSQELMISGDVAYEKFVPTLYNVLRAEAIHDGLAREYTGIHQDSMTGVGSKKIYHWYAANDTEGTAIQNKNNVIFGNHCWQMIRTTDTGGVKLIYNGEPENDQCLNTRGYHIGYNARTSITLSSNYWYGTDYTYDSTNRVFSISGAKEQVTWNATTGPELIGKYTCRNTSVDGTCSTLYLVESYEGSASAYVIPLDSYSHYSEFGSLHFNTTTSSEVSPADVGYMRGNTRYSTSVLSPLLSQEFTDTQTMLVTTSLATNYWYADSVTWGSPVANKYNLNNPYQISSTDDYPSLVGKYTFINATQTYTRRSVLYIAGVSGSNMYYKLLTDGATLEPIVFGSSITDNGNGTYTLNNPVSVSLTDWYINYANYENKYTCNDSSTTCANPRYITETTLTNYTYVNAGEKRMIGKTRNGLVLNDTILVRNDELVISSSNYSDYKYTCNTTSATCTEETLRMIYSYSETGYNYVENRYFGSGITWDGTNYTLIDPIEIENYNNLNNLSTHHYFCFDVGSKSCPRVLYIYSYQGVVEPNYHNMKYLNLRDGAIIDNMLTSNTKNSTIKSGVDAWYKHNMLFYDGYIEDTIFCNDRSVRTLGGWDPNGGSTTETLQFKEYNVTSDLSCTNITDKFSISNNSAKLDYKVGLMSSPEANILNNAKARETRRRYWLLSPEVFDGNEYVRTVSNSGYMDDYAGWTNVGDGVRPVISLKPGIEYISGDGSMANPYIVDVEPTFISLNDTDISFRGVNGSFTLIADTNVEGNITWESANTSIATVNSNGVVTPVGFGRTTITAKIGVISANVTVEVKAPFDYDSLSTIMSNVRNGITNEYHVGDTKEINMGSLGTHTLRIANMSTPAECSTTGFSQTACGFVLEFADTITNHRMNASSTNVGGWSATEMRTYLNNDVYNALPNELQSAIIDTTVVSGHGKTSGQTNVTSTDKLYLLSTHEVWEDADGSPSSGISYYDTAYNDTRQLDYYAGLNVTTSNYSGANKKNTTWWLRSAYYSSTSNFYRAVSGSTSYTTATVSNAVSPAFRIG